MQARMNLEETVKIVRNASTDDEKLAALFIVAKVLKGGNLDGDGRKTLFSAVGFPFLQRLLKTEKTSEGCSKWTYKSLAISILCSFCTDKDMVSSPEMLENLQHFNKIITDIPGSSEDVEEHRVLSDTYECLSHLATQPVSVDSFITQHTVTALCQAVAHGSHGWQKAHQLLLYIVNMRGSETWQGNLEGLQHVLKHFTHQFSQEQDELKFGICSTLYILLATTTKEQISQIKSSEWSTNLQNTVFMVLRNKLGGGQREPVLKLACTVADLLGIEWTIGTEDTENKFLLLLVHLCCIEVRMALESDDLETIEDKGDLLCSCYLLLENVITYMSVCPSLQLDSKRVQQLHSAMRGAFQAVLYFLQQVQIKQPQKDHAMTVASVRVLGAWIAEETSALQEEVINILPFLLALSKRGFEQNQPNQAQEGKDEPIEDVLKFLLPGICHLSSEEKARRVIVQEKGLELLGRYFSHQYSVFTQQGDGQRETEVALTTLCGIFLNFIVMETDLVSTDHVFSELLSFLITTLHTIDDDQLILAFNLCVMCLMLLRHHSNSLQVSSTDRDNMLASVVQLLSVHELCQIGGNVNLVVKQKFADVWSEVAELWFLGMQALNACVSLFPQLTLEILKAGWIPNVTQFLLQVKAEELDDMTRDSYLGLLLQLAKKGGDVRQLMLEHNGLKVAQGVIRMPVLFTSISSLRLQLEELHWCLMASNMQSKKDKPTTVEVGIFILGFSAVSDVSMDYKVSVMLRQKWEDPRLHFSGLSSRNFLSLPGHSSELLWVPDLIFVNEKEAHVHKITVPNKLVRIYGNGTVLYSQRLTLVLSCSMKLHRFPFDEQVCLMEMESFAYTIDTVKFVWNEEALDVAKNLELPQFQLNAYNTAECAKEYYTGSYPCLTVQFHLKRDIGFHFVQSYVPTSLIVLISWLSFWVDLDATAARISLGVTTVLTMVTLNTGFRSSLPPVSYIKAIDVWTSACLIFVFCSLLEFAVVNSIHRQSTKKENLLSNRSMEINYENFDSDNKTTGLRFKLDHAKRARSLDKLSRIVFPVIFLVFNVIYWVVTLV